MRKYPRHYSALFSGYCCEHNPKSVYLNLYGFILPMFQQITSLIYGHWIHSFVDYWKSKEMSNFSKIKRSTICERCIKCRMCYNTTICVFCCKNAEHFDELEALKRKADKVASDSKFLIASTENSLMPMVQLAFLFPTVISSFPKDPIRTEKMTVLVEDVQDNWVFIGTVFSITSSIISMAASQTSTYFASTGKESQKSLINRIVYGLSIILQVSAKVLAYQVFAFGIFGFYFGANAIMVALFLLPPVMSIIKVLFLYGSMYFSQDQCHIDYYSNFKSLLLTSGFVLVRIKGSLKANKDKTKTLSGLFEHMIYDIISFVETFLFTIFGAHLILDENFNKFIFCSTVTGIHGLGLLVKCTYYQHMHPWMNLSSNQQRMNKFMNFIYGCLGVTIVALLFYFGIHFGIIAFIVGGSLIISLVRVNI